uniref:Uncharacterized protein n=1 Tax=Brassica oleracea var. oleracea TaxID=109376 RepID=A0A0D2ZR67_BRAOL
MAHMKALFHYVKMDQFMMFSGSSSGFRVCSCIWLIKIFNYDRKRYFKKMFERLYQAEWKPEFPDRFSEISELVKSVDSLKLEDGKSQVARRKPSRVSALSCNTYIILETVFLMLMDALLFVHYREMSKNALKNKKKKGAEAAASGANNA